MDTPWRSARERKCDNNTKIHARQTRASITPTGHTRYAQLSNRKQAEERKREKKQTEEIQSVREKRRETERERREKIQKKWQGRTKEYSLNESDS